MKRDNKFLMPDIIGMDIDKAKKILDEKGILYEDEVESKFSFIKIQSSERLVL